MSRLSHAAPLLSLAAAVLALSALTGARTTDSTPSSERRAGLPGVSRWRHRHDGVGHGSLARLLHARAAVREGVRHRSLRPRLRAAAGRVRRTGPHRFAASRR